MGHLDVEKRLAFGLRRNYAFRIECEAEVVLEFPVFSRVSLNFGNLRDESVLAIPY